jgi:hypothetical protein
MAPRAGLLHEFQLQRERHAGEAEIGRVHLDHRGAPDVGPDERRGSDDIGAGGRMVGHRNLQGRRECRAFSIASATPASTPMARV